MSAPTSDGSSQVTSYQLQIRFDDSQDWNTVMGASTPNLILIYNVDGVEAGKYVQARYRCSNEIGWSDWSDHDYLLKAGVPERPPKPVYVASDATSVTI